MNTSPAFLAMTNLVRNIIFNTSSEAYKKLTIERNLELINQFWYLVGKVHTQDLTRKDMLHILDNSVIEGFDDMPVEVFATGIMNFTDKENNGFISFSSISELIRSSRLEFNKISVRVKNETGISIKFCTKSFLDDLIRIRPMASAMDIIAEFESLGNGKTLPLQAHEIIKRHLFESGIALPDQMVIFIPDCKVLDEIPLSAYHSQMFLLKPIKKIIRKRRKGSLRNRHRNSIGFDPYLIIVPNFDIVDTVTLSVQSSISIEAHTPIDIRVVRLTSSSLDILYGTHKRKEGRNQMELSSKHLPKLLGEVVENAPIIFERNGLEERSKVSLPITVLLSFALHALIIRDFTDDGMQRWRTPILLTKEFLHNSQQLSGVVQSHASCGIIVERNRLNVYRSEKSRSKEYARTRKNATAPNITNIKTAWATTIQIKPSFVLLNALPFSILFRSWQLPQESFNAEWKKEIWMNPDTATKEDNTDVDDESSLLSTIKRHTKVHYDESDFNKAGHVSSGGIAKLNGIEMNDTLYIEVSQDFKTDRNDLNKLTWISPLAIELGLLRKVGTKIGSLRLPTIRGRLGDSVCFCIDVTAGRNAAPYCTLFSPFWILNKTGMKMQYKFTGCDIEIHDSGAGGLPVLAACYVEEKPRKSNLPGVTKREISVVPLEGPKKQNANVWWNTELDGELVVSNPSLIHHGKKMVEWSDKIGLDVPGSFGEVKCKNILFGSSIDTLTGVFNVSNLVTFMPRYVVKNQLYMPISFIPILGSLYDVKKKAKSLSEDNVNSFGVAKYSTLLSMNLQPSQATIIYYFEDVSKMRQDSEKKRFLCLRTDIARWNNNGKWHVVPFGVFGSTYCLERDGLFDSIVGIYKCDVLQLDATTVMNIMDASVCTSQSMSTFNHHINLIAHMVLLSFWSRHNVDATISSREPEQQPLLTIQPG